MNKRTTYGRSAAALAFVALCTASTASAALTETATDCRATVAKSYSKLVKTAFKTINGCHKSRDKDATLIAVDCNDMDAADAAKQKYASAAQKHVESVVNACGTDSDGLLTAANNIDKEWYISCPVTCPDVPTTIETMEDVARCQGCEASSLAGGVTTEALGLPDPATLSDEDIKCRGAISKGYAKLVDTSLKAETSCQKTADSSGTNDYTACAGSDPKGKVQAAGEKAAAGLASSCAGADFAGLDSCASDLAGLQACNLAAWSGAEDDLYQYIYEMPTLICPNHLRTTIRGGCGIDGDPEPASFCNGGTCENGRNDGLVCATNTDCPQLCSIGYPSGTTLSVGWTGLAHRVDVTDFYTLSGKLDCGEGAVPGACGDCTVTGISEDNIQYEDFARCRNDQSQKCYPPFGTDPLCPGTGECEYYLGPPLAVSAGGTPTCSLNVVESNITGTANPDTGAGDLMVHLNTIVHTGDSISRPCPVCRGDDTAQDGARDGVCVGGTRDGLTCDVQGFDLSFAPTDPALPQDGVSLDCPPADGQAIGTLKINLPLTTGTSTKDAVDPCESPKQALNCFCGVCSGDTTISCDSDANCAGVCVGGLSAGNSCVTSANCPGSCSGGTNNGGTCTSNSACTGSCTGGSNPGTTCSNSSVCTGTCSGGANAGSNCSTNTNCADACVGGTNAGASCTTDATCTGSCTGGGDNGDNCATNGDCSLGCIGGSNDGTDCTTNGDCTGTCAGGSDVGNACSSDANCSSACLGGDNDGTPCADDTPCTGGGTCSDIGTCGTIGTCTDAGTCGGQGSCTDDGTCGGQGTCGTFGTCTGTGSCSGSLGVCGKGGSSGVNRRPNNCTGDTCFPVAGQTDRGQCVGSDVERYCDGILLANGKGVMGCSTNASCAANVSESEDPDEWACPGNDCGNCTVQQTRSCFLDPIVITGTPDTENPILVGTFCLPPSANGSVNSTTGSPGPGVVQTDAIIEKRY
jgi:hypothetical protein